MKYRFQHPFFVIPNGILCLLLLVSCKDEKQKYKTYTQAGLYSIQAPAILSPTKKLSKDAELQLRNVNQDLYLILRISQRDSLQNLYPGDSLFDFYHLHLDNLHQQLEDPVIQGPDTIAQHWLRGLRGRIKGEYKGQLLTHQLVVLQDSLYIYQILEWMPSPKWKEWEGQMDSIIRSFRPLGSDMP